MTLTALIMTRGTSITFLSLALGLGGLTWAGFGVNHLDVAPKYAAILMGISNTVGTIPGIICPSLTGAIVIDRVSRRGEREEYLENNRYLNGRIHGGRGLFMEGQIIYK